MNDSLNKTIYYNIIKTTIEVMQRIVLTWGLIPNDNLSKMIYCGDQSTSQTEELNFEIIGDSCKGIDNDFDKHFSTNELWNPGSKIYDAISAFLSNFFGISISPELVYGGYVLLNDEADDHSSSFEIIDSEAGVFINDNKQHNGKVYLRYYFEESEEIYDEKVCVVTIN